MIFFNAYLAVVQRSSSYGRKRVITISLTVWREFISTTFNDIVTTQPCPRRLKFYGGAGRAREM